MMKKDTENIKDFLAGNMNGFNNLYIRYERQLFFYIKSMVYSRETAEDIFQEVWLQVIKKLPKFSFKGVFRNWLYTIAHHKTIDFIRKSGKEKTVSISQKLTDEAGLTYEDILEDKAPDIISQLTAKELEKKLEEIVKELPDLQREVFLLRCDAGMKFKEIAKLTKVSLNTVLGRMHYALKKVRAIIDENIKD